MKRSLPLAARIGLVVGWMMAIGNPEAGAQPILERIEARELKAIMDGEGYATEIDEDGDILWRVDGLRAYILISESRMQLLFRLAFSGTEATLPKVNEWNRTRSLSRSFLDEDGDPVLELDLDLEGGVTRARVVDYLKTCRLTIGEWVRAVVR